MNDLSFDLYQCFAADTAIYPESGTGSPMALAYVGLGLGEIGEIQGKIKKILRDSDGVVTDEARSAIRAEIGDALWYLARLCSELSIPFGDAAERNVAKLASRQERGVLHGSGDDR